MPTQWAAIKTISKLIKTSLETPRNNAVLTRRKIKSNEKEKILSLHDKMKERTKSQKRRRNFSSILLLNSTNCPIIVITIWMLAVARCGWLSHKAEFARKIDERMKIFGKSAYTMNFWRNIPRRWQWLSLRAFSVSHHIWWHDENPNKGISNAIIIFFPSWTHCDEGKTLNAEHEKERQNIWKTKTKFQFGFCRIKVFFSRIPSRVESFR